MKMVKHYVLKPSTWEADGPEPKTISFTPEDIKAPAVDFITRGKIVVRPCLNKHALALKAYGPSGFSIIPRGAGPADEPGTAPPNVVVMISIGDKIAIPGVEYTFVVESAAVRKPKKKKRKDNDDDDDDDDSWGSSSSFSSDDDSDDDDDVIMKDVEEEEANDIKLSAEKEKLFNDLLPIYPTITRRELRIIAQNINTAYDATSVIFDPNTVPVFTSIGAEKKQSEEGLSGSQSNLSSSVSLIPPPGSAQKNEEDNIDPSVKRIMEAFPGITVETAQMAYEMGDKEESVAIKYLKENAEAVNIINNIDDDDNDHNAHRANKGSNGVGRIKGWWHALRNHGRKNNNDADDNIDNVDNIDNTDDNNIIGAAPEADKGALGQLKAMFPDASVDVLNMVLASCANDVNAAANKLLMMAPEDLVQGGANDNGIYGAQDVNFVAPSAPPMRKDPADRRKDMRGMDIMVDPYRPWQSSGEKRDDYIEYIFDNVKFIRDDVELQHTAVSIQMMIEREQDRYNDSYCFYHSYSVAHLDYELNSLIATIVYDLDIERYEDEWNYKEDFIFPPVPRAIFKPFTKIKNFKEFESFCTSGRRNNNDPNFQAVGLSVSTSIFSTSSPAPPIALFRAGYSAVAVDFDKLMRELLDECGLSTEKKNRVFDVLHEKAREFNMPVGTSGFARVATDRATGHMLQIFINKEIVDEYAYPSQCLGYRDGKMTMSATLSAGKTNGQARIYITPDLFRSEKYSHLYYYCADKHFDSVRKSFVKAVKEELKFLFKDEETRRTIKHNIREKYGKIPN